MSPWTESHIGIIYFAGLIVPVVVGILILIYLKPVKEVISKITGKFNLLWNHSFKPTIIFAGLLGALSITFKDCNGSYEGLLDSRNKTIMKGLEQVSASFDYLAIALGFWLIFFILMWIMQKKNIKT